MMLATRRPPRPGAVRRLPAALADPAVAVRDVFGKMLALSTAQFNVTLRGIGLGALQQDWLGAQLDRVRRGFRAARLPHRSADHVLPVRREAINMSLIEAAVVDGAGTARIFRTMLFPLLRNTHKTVILSVLLGSFRAFDFIFFSTNGAPSGRRRSRAPTSTTRPCRGRRSATRRLRRSRPATRGLRHLGRPDLRLPRRRETVKSPREARGRKPHAARLRLLASSPPGSRLHAGPARALALWWLFPLYSAVRGALQFGGLHNFTDLLEHPVSGVWLPHTFLNSAVIAVLHAGIGLRHRRPVLGLPSRA